MHITGLEFAELREQHSYNLKNKLQLAALYLAAYFNCLFFNVRVR
jgi:hypothetical protein